MRNILQTSKAESTKEKKGHRTNPFQGFSSHPFLVFKNPTDVTQMTSNKAKNHGLLADKERT